MSNYGRNFEFRVSPRHGERGGRYKVAGSNPIPIGAPVVTNGTLDENGLLEVTLATGDQPKPLPGQGGILVFEHISLAGYDPGVTTYSDLDAAPVGKAVQVINGDQVKVVLRNTVDRTVGNVRTYGGKVMVPDLASTPPEVGDLLTPGVGDASSGYWDVTLTAANGWLVVTAVDTDRGEVEARLNF